MSKLVAPHAGAARRAAPLALPPRPHHDGITFAVNCRQCTEPLCVKACIGGALSLENGVVVIDQSKCVGCYSCIMDEAQAHRYIEKQAMDLRRSRYEISVNILKTYR